MLSPRRLPLHQFSFSSAILLAVLPAFLLFAVRLSFAGGGPPATFQHSVSFGGETVTVDFVLHSARGSSFAVQEELSVTGLTPVVAGPVRTYLGTVQGHPSAMASGLFRSNGAILCRVSFEDGKEWIDLGNGTVNQRGSDWTPSWPDYVPITGGAGSTVSVADVGIDLPNAQIISSGGTTAAALEMAEYSVNTTNLIYLRDSGTMNQIERVIVRMDPVADPYAGMTTTNQLLTEIGNQWNNVLPAGVHDIALVASTQVGGGLASVGVIGNPGYSSNGADSNGDFSVVWRHEAGHNWSLSHFDGNTPEGPTINSGNSLSRMSGPELEKVRRHRDARAANLVNLGAYSFSIPPRASIDSAQVEPASGAVQVDVLGNDHDTNGDALTVLSFDLTSSMGNAVTRSVGTGPGGRDELSYTPGGGFSTATDHFFYRVQDSTGREGIASVVIRTRMEGDALGHWSFNDDTDPKALDSSATLRHGDLGSGATKAGGLLTLDGVGDAIAVEGFNKSLNTVTFSGWIKRDGDQTGFSGLFFSRGGSTTSGLNFGNNNELRYHWADSDWGFDSGLVVPDGVWTFVALVIESTQSTFYMDAGTGLQQVVRAHANIPEAFDTSFHIGRDPSGSRRFRGQMDDVHIFAKALSLAEITELSSRGGKACDPLPRIGETVIASSTRLHWTSNAIAGGHRVFFSTSYTAVRDGVSGSAADQGVVTSSFFDTSSLAPGTYYWRVDPMNPSGEIKGHLWAFQVLPSGLVGHWKLDETTGSTASEVAGNYPGTWQGDPSLGQAGASLGTMSSACLDGAGDYAEVPFNAALNPTEFTISTWARADGGSGSFRSPLTARDDGPQRGYIFYATNGDNWSFWQGTGSGWSILDGTPVVEGEWVHLVGTYDGTTQRFFVDGVERNSRQTAFAQNTARPLRIGSGATEGANGFDFNGCVDDVRIWNRALSAGEIARLSEYHRWTQATALGSGSSPGDDDDNDDVLNIFEFGLDTDPLAGHGPDGGLGALPEFVQVGNEIRGRITLPKTARAELTYRLQRSNDLASNSWSDFAVKMPNATWQTSISGIIFRDADTPGLQWIEWPMEGASVAQRFWRLTLEAGD